MKCEILFSRKNKKNIVNVSSVELAQRVVKVKICKLRYFMQTPEPLPDYTSGQSGLGLHSLHVPLYWFSNATHISIYNRILITRTPMA